jgi:hypothetical protein
MGDHPHGQYVQRVNSQTMAKLVANFRAEAAKSGQSFAGKPFYIGHPDVPHLANQFPDKKAYGWVMDMAEAIGWALRASEVERDGAQTFGERPLQISLAVLGLWRKRREGNRQAVLAKPVELVSVGLTNAQYQRGAAAGERERNDMQKKLAALAALLTLANDASPEAIAEAARRRGSKRSTPRRQPSPTRKRAWSKRLGAENDG